MPNGVIFQIAEGPWPGALVLERSDEYRMKHTRQIIIARLPNELCLHRSAGYRP